MFTTENLDCNLTQRDRSCRILGGESGSGAGFLRVLRFLLPIAPYSSIILSSTLYSLGMELNAS
jgi:hypothetical protein